MEAIIYRFSHLS